MSMAHSFSMASGSCWSCANRPAAALRAAVFGALLVICAASLSPLAIGAEVVSLLETRHDRVVLQHWDLSCGAAALATILKYEYGQPVTERQIAVELLQRKEYLVNPSLVRVRQGYSLLDLQRVAEQRHLQGLGLGNLTLRDLMERAPIIVHVRFLGYHHFVGFRGVYLGQVVLADPAWGNRTMLIGDFVRAWINYPRIGHTGFSLLPRGGSKPRNRLAPTASDLVLAYAAVDQDGYDTPRGGGDDAPTLLAGPALDITPVPGVPALGSGLGSGDEPTSVAALTQPPEVVRPPPGEGQAAAAEDVSSSETAMLARNTDSGAAGAEAIPLVQSVASPSSARLIAASRATAPGAADSSGAGLAGSAYAVRTSPSAAARSTNAISTDPTTSATSAPRVIAAGQSGGQTAAGASHPSAAITQARGGTAAATSTTPQNPAEQVSSAQPADGAAQAATGKVQKVVATAAQRGGTGSAKVSNTAAGVAASSTRPAASSTLQGAAVKVPTHAAPATAAVKAATGTVQKVNATAVQAAETTSKDVSNTAGAVIKSATTSSVSSLTYAHGGSSPQPAVSAATGGSKPARQAATSVQSGTRAISSTVESTVTIVTKTKTASPDIPTASTIVASSPHTNTNSANTVENSVDRKPSAPDTAEAMPSTVTSSTGKAQQATRSSLEETSDQSKQASDSSKAGRGSTKGPSDSSKAAIESSEVNRSKPSSSKPSSSKPSSSKPVPAITTSLSTVSKPTVSSGSAPPPATTALRGPGH